MLEDAVALLSSGAAGVVEVVAAAVLAFSLAKASLLDLSTLAL